MHYKWILLLFFVINDAIAVINKIKKLEFK